MSILAEQTASTRLARAASISWERASEILTKKHVRPMISLVLVGIFLHRGYISSGLLSWGDWPYWSDQTLKSFFQLPAKWEQTRGLGYLNVDLNVGPLYLVMGTLANLGLSFETIERLLILWPSAILPLVGMYWMLGRFEVNTFARVGGALLYGTNSYFMTIQLQHLYIAISYGIAPIALGSLLVSLDRARSDKGLRELSVWSTLTGLLFALILSIDARIALLTFGSALLLTLFDLRTSSRKIKTIGIFGFAMGVVILAQLYWILPAVIGGGGSAYSNALPPTPFSNFFMLPHALLLSMPFYTSGEPVWFSVNPPMLPLIVLPVLAFLGLATGEKKFVTRYTCLALLACLGVFLVKGQNHPFGNFYLWGFTRIPGLQLFRDASKFAFLIALGYSVLIAVFLDQATQWLHGSHKGRPVRKLQRQLAFWPQKWSRLRQLREPAVQIRTVAAIAIASFVVACTFGSRAAIAGNMGGTTTPIEVPKEFRDFGAILEADHQFGRVLWLPAVARFESRNNLHPSTDAGALKEIYGSVETGQQLAPAGDPRSSIEIVDSPRFNDILRLAGVRYVAVQNNPSSENWLQTVAYGDRREISLDRIKSSLDQDENLAPLISQPNLVVKQVRGSSPRFSASSGTDVDDLTDGTELASSTIGQLKYRLESGPIESKPVIRMSETYDDGWTAAVQVRDEVGNWSNRPSEHVALADGTNGWITRDTGDINAIRATVTYKPQITARWGFILSSVFVVAAVGFVMVFGKFRRMDRWNQKGTS